MDLSNPVPTVDLNSTDTIPDKFTWKIGMTVFPIHIANLDIHSAHLAQDSSAWTCVLEIGTEAIERFEFYGEEQGAALLKLVEALSVSSGRKSRSLRIKSAEHDGVCSACVAVFKDDESRASNDPVGVGRYRCSRPEHAMVLAAVRAASHAGILKPRYRANNQKAFRDWAKQLSDDLSELSNRSELPQQWRAKETEAVILEHFNRVASAAVITATNHPRQDKLLQLYDASAWLYDTAGHKRIAFTDTQSWLAWFPGLDGKGRTVQDVVQSMPSAPDSAIPWIVRVFENPKSWMKLRGAQTLADHDCLHVLLGRGLQDQDEAFVIGFAMGTAKQIPFWQQGLLEFAISRLYPEPYRVPVNLLPAFRLGVQCGRETGMKDLYKKSLTALAHLDIDQARAELEIDIETLRAYYTRERAQIPGTVASARL